MTVKKKKSTDAKRAKTGGKRRTASGTKRKRLKRDKDDLFGFMIGKIKIVGDIMSPLPDWEHWHPEKSE